MKYELLERLSSHIEDAKAARIELITALCDLAETCEEVAGDDMALMVRLYAPMALTHSHTKGLDEILTAVGKAADREFEDYYDAVEDARIASDIEDAQRDGTDALIAKHLAAALDRIMS